MSTRKILFILASIAILAGAIYGYTRYETLYPSTDDAYIQANTVQMAAQVSGPVASVQVHDHQFVQARQVLFTLDPRPFVLAIQRAQAQLAQAEAVLVTQSKNTMRILKLVQAAQLPKADADDAQGKLDEASANVRMAQAELAQARLNLQYTTITAPAAGYVTQFTLRQGQMVQMGDPLFALVENQQWWVDANFKETDLARIRRGQAAKITVDIYPGITFKGVVQGISAGSGAAFALLPPENATGNWVKVTQRFTVRVNILTPDPRYPLRIGASSIVRIDTRQKV